MKDMMRHHLSILERDEDEVDTEKRDPEQILRMADRLKLYKTIRPFLPSEDCESAADGSRETSPFATIWEVSLLCFVQVCFVLMSLVAGTAFFTSGGIGSIPTPNA
jgi:hypothetical protein